MPIQLVGAEAKKLAASNTVGFVFTSRAEEQFYLTNNLPEQLGSIFAGINTRRLDEDLLELQCKRALKLVLDSYLLEEFIAQSYLAMKNSKLEGGQMILRRPESKLLEPAGDRRGALIALKRVWSHDWAFDAVLKRLDTKGKIGIDAKATYIFAKI